MSKRLPTDRLRLVAAQAGQWGGSLTGWIRGSWLAPSAVPVSVSLGIHALIVFVLAGIAWQVAVVRDADKPLAIQIQPATDPSDLPQIKDDNPLPALPALSDGTGIEGSKNASDASEDAPGASSTPATLARSGSGESGTLEALSGGRSSSMGGVAFAGLRARQARTIVYVVDGSGSMVSSFTWVVRELRRSIDSLDPEQKFQVILFRDRPPTRNMPATLTDQASSTGLLPATPENKARVGQWLTTMTPVGRSNPLDGLVKGLEYSPDVVFLLSRSIRRSGGIGGQAPAWSLGREATLARLEQANPRDIWNGRRRVVIKALQFMEDDPTGTMQAISQQHGDGEGSYRIVKPEETTRQ